MRLKIEINTREHFVVHGLIHRELAVDNPWFTGRAEVTTFTLSELLGSKLRALHQRRKDRDLFDLALGLEHPEAKPDELVAAFERYMDHGETTVTRAKLEASMAAKMVDPTFLNDTKALLRSGLEYDAAEAWSTVHQAIVTRLRGAPWKGAAE